MIALVDCNNFYASCEIIFNPSIKNRPIIVLSNNDGCVIARSNSSKKLGIKMGVPVFKIKKIKEKFDVIVFSSNFTLYGDISNRIMSIISSLFPKVEIYSVDEAFIDLSLVPYEKIIESTTQLKNMIKQYTGIPVSIGISSTKTLAKVANIEAKKNSLYNGVFMLNNEQDIDAVLSKLDVEKVWGIGRRSSILLKYYGVRTAFNLKKTNSKWIKKHLTVKGLLTVKELNGEKCIDFQYSKIQKKSIRTSRSFLTEIYDLAVLERYIAMFAERCSEKLRKDSLLSKKVSVFLQTNYFKKGSTRYFNTSSRNLDDPTSSSIDIIKHSLACMRAIYRSSLGYKKGGVILSSIVNENNVQGNLFSNVEDSLKQKKIMSSIDSIKSRMGRDSIRHAVQGRKNIKINKKSLSLCYTTNWNDIFTININAN